MDVEMVGATVKACALIRRDAVMVATNFMVDINFM